MGQISSPVPTIENITISPWPTKPVRDVAIIRVDRIIVGITGGGAVYCNQFNKKAYYAFPWRGTEDLLIALVKLGRIAPEQYDAHCQQQDALTRCNARRFAANQVLIHAAKAGIQLSPEQMKTLKPEEK